MRRSKGTVPARPLTVTCSPGTESARPISAASQILPGPVCSSAKPSARSASAAPKARPASAATRFTLLITLSKCLAYADIDLKWAVDLAFLKGKRQIEADRPDRRVIAQAD